MTTAPGPFIPIAKPTLGREEATAVAQVLATGWITQGPAVEAFEAEFAAWVGAPHACAVSNCTAALQLALQAVGVRPGDEVITVSHSFIATANSIRSCGAMPVFVDVQAATGNIDPALIEDACSNRTRAVLVVHQLGLPCDLTAVRRVARARGLPVVEDAACAVGSEIFMDETWRRIGLPHGDVACFSFHPRKLLTTGDGGMLTTRREDLDRQFRLRRQHGMSVSDRLRHTSDEVVFEAYEEFGFNYRLTDIQAAIGREQLKRLSLAVSRRRALADRYAELLRAVPGISLPCEPEWARSNWQSYSVTLPRDVVQRTVMTSLQRAGIATRRGVMCAHREPAFPAGTWRGSGPLTESERRQDRTLMLPMFESLTDSEQERVATALVAACRT